jgi:hypothetical protein
LATSGQLFGSNCCARHGAIGHVRQCPETCVLVHHLATSERNRYRPSRGWSPPPTNGARRDGNGPRAFTPREPADVLESRKLGSTHPPESPLPRRLTLRECVPVVWADPMVAHARRRGLAPNWTTARIKSPPRGTWWCLSRRFLGRSHAALGGLAGPSTSCARPLCENGATGNRWNGLGKLVTKRSTFPRCPSRLVVRFQFHDPRDRVACVATGGDPHRERSHGGAWNGSEKQNALLGAHSPLPGGAPRTCVGERDNS